MQTNMHKRPPSGWAAAVCARMRVGGTHTWTQGIAGKVPENSKQLASWQGSGVPVGQGRKEAVFFHHMLFVLLTAYRMPFLFFIF